MATHQRPTVLIEDPDPAWRRMMEGALPDLGYDVAFCDGPAHLPGGCRLVEQGACPLVESADVVLNSLNLDELGNREVLAALHTFHPRTPVIALVSHREAREHPSCLHGCTVEHFPTTIHDLLGLLEQLLSS
jgi:CheY-like chemotaxis protein